VKDDGISQICYLSKVVRGSVSQSSTTRIEERQTNRAWASLLKAGDIHKCLLSESKQIILMVGGFVKLLRLTTTDLPEKFYFF